MHKAVIRVGWYFLITSSGTNLAPPRQFGPFDSIYRCPW
jgi:hypothetical protein